MTWMRLGSAMLLAFTPLAFIGCGSGDGINHGGKLFGNLTIDSKPVSAAEIVLFTEDGKHSVSGRSKNDGTYIVSEPPLGKCKIVVKTSQNKQIPPAGAARGPVNFTDPATGEWPIYVTIPPRYEEAATADLSVEVKKGDQEHDITLTAK